MRRTLLKFALASAVLAAALPAPAQTVTQSIELRPGWNAVFLEVRPEPADPAAVFGSIPAGLTFEAAWMWNGRPSGRDFVKDASEAVVSEPGWLGWFPPASGHDFLSNLLAVVPQRAYLVKVSGAAPQTWSVTGVPVKRAPRWVADSMTLTGLAVDPGAKPTFASYLAPSPAHAGRPAWTLDANGQWRQVDAAAERIEPGVAYWFDVLGASSYEGPVTVAVDGGDELEYGQLLVEQGVTASTVLAAGATVSLRLLAAPGTAPLRYRKTTASGAFEWPALPDPLNVPVTAGEEAHLRVAADRSALAGDRVTSILEATTSAGGRWLIPVGVSRANSGIVAFEPFSSRRFAAQASPSHPAAGLWVGSVTVDQVGNSQGSGPPAPTPVKHPFELRLILHVDAAGTVHLLKEVLQMWKDGTYNPDGTVATPGRYVLLSDRSLASSFTGATLRDGEPVARRVTSIDFDFSAPGSKLPMTGTFGGTGTLAVTIDLPHDFPTNPFRHKFHPDHDNANPDTDFDIRRSIQLQFSATDPEAVPGGPPVPPGWGESVTGGTYRETLSAPAGELGLHRNPVAIEGTFRLTRVALTGALEE